MNADSFFRFPHTPHIAWMGEGRPRDDKVLSPGEAAALLSGPVLVEEKLDGANLGISLGPDAQPRVQNRGQYLIEPYTGQFSRLSGWLAQHRFALADTLEDKLILFGEWCAARHSLGYDSLPDWFLLFDVYDRAQDRFWGSTRRNELAESLSLAVVPPFSSGQTSLAKLKILLTTRASHYRDGPAEGLVIRSESTDGCDVRAKLVRGEFVQTIDEHWRSRTLEWNRVQHPMTADT